MDDTSKLADKIKSLEEKVKNLNKARDQLSKEWLEVERKKSILAAAIEYSTLGFILLDDYQNITLKNPAADKIMGKNIDESWMLEDMQRKITNQFDLSSYDLKNEVERCYRERIPTAPTDVNLAGRKVRIFLSPINILKKSITSVGVVMILEEI